jgi:hypothetical protein
LQELLDKTPDGLLVVVTYNRDGKLCRKSRDCLVNVVINGLLQDNDQ